MKTMRRCSQDRSVSVAPQRGFTLIELIISMGIFAVVSLAAFSVLSSSQQSATMNDQTTQIQKNVRLALDLISRDLRMTGYGNPAAGALAGCGQHLNATDNAVGADAGPDSIAVMAVDSQIGTLNAAMTAGNQMQVANLSSDVAVDLAAGKAVLVNLEGIFTASVTAAGGTTLTLGTSLSPSMTFPKNTPVLRLSCVTYTVTDKGGQVGGAGTVYAPYQLLRNAVPIVDGIEDLQLAYALDTDGDGKIDDQAGGGALAGTFDCLDFVPNNTACIQGAPPALAAGTVTTLPATVNASPTAVRQIRVTVVGRAIPPVAANTPNNCWTDKTFTSGAALQAEDHLLTAPVFPAGCALAGKPAGIRRRALTKIVTLRNETT